jgi:hypothetical protein
MNAKQRKFVVVYGSADQSKDTRWMGFDRDIHIGIGYEDLVSVAWNDPPPGQQWVLSPSRSHLASDS